MKWLNEHSLEDHLKGGRGARLYRQSRYTSDSVRLGLYQIATLDDDETVISITVCWGMLRAAPMYIYRKIDGKYCLLSSYLRDEQILKAQQASVKLKQKGDRWSALDG